MAITVKLDLYGTTQTTGITGSRYDQAVRLCLVEGLTADTAHGHNNINTAINSVLDVVGLFHHRIGFGVGGGVGIGGSGQFRNKLPVQSATGTKFGPTSVWVTLRYSRGRHTFTDANKAHSYPGIEAIPVYRLAFNPANGDTMINERGLPSGPMLNNLVAAPGNILEDPAYRPPHIMWKRVVQKITIPTVLSFHPLQEVAGLLNHINSDSISLGGIQFAPFTIRFDGVNVDADGISTHVGQFYFCEYEFTAIDRGFYRQFPVWNPALSPAQWDTTEGLVYEQAPFNGAFPYSP